VKLEPTIKTQDGHLWAEIWNLDFSKTKD